MSLHNPISPLKAFYVQKVLPAVYDDSLSYYEILCKVQETLNEVVSTTNEQSVVVLEMQQAIDDFINGGYTDTFEEYLDKWFEENSDAFVQRLIDEGIIPEVANIQSDLSTVHENIAELVASDTSIRNDMVMADTELTEKKVPYPLVNATPSYGTSGQVLATNADGTTDWKDPVVPSDAQAEQVITQWLNDHPEATTTVQDGAVTTAKIANDAVTTAKISDNAVTDDKLVQNGGILEDFSVLNTAYQNIVDSETILPDNLLNPQNITTGYYWTNGYNESDSYSNTGYIPVNEGDTYYLWSDSGTGVFRKLTMRFVVGYDQSKSYVISSEQQNIDSYTVPHDVKYIIISAVPDYFSSHGMITTNGDNAVYSEYFTPYNNYELNMQYIDAYTREEFNLPELFSELEVSPQMNIYNKSTSTDNEFVATTGIVSENENYCHSAKIPVSSGKTYYFWALYNANVVSATARFLCAYNENNEAISASGGTYVSNYTVPDGITYIVLSFEKNRKNLFMVMEGSEQPDGLVPYNLEHYIARESFVSKALSAIMRGNIFVRSTNNTAVANQEYSITDNLDAKKNCAYMFFGKFNSFTSIEIGHGKTESGANYIVIDDTNIISYKPDGSVYQTTPHGISFSNFISVSIKVADTDTARATITLLTDAHSVTLSNIIFFGCNGSIYYKCGQTTTDVEFVYTLMDLNKDVYIFGDSYTSLADDKRWPYYAIGNNDNNILLCGFAGAKSIDEYPSFETITNMKTPKCLGWFLGMNDPDAVNQINTDWVIYVSQVLSYCDANGIVPILATIPNTPTQRNIEKNDWVKSSGRRYVDFAKAVGGEEANSQWYTNMLSSDNVHPTAEGAKALWLQLRMDLPEIMKGIS